MCYKKLFFVNNKQKGVFMWEKKIEEVLEEFNTKKEGLSSKETEQRLTLNGKNEIPQGKKNTIVNIFIEQFKSPIILILIISAIFAIATGSKADSIFIIIVITINAVIGTYQELISEKSAEKLQNMIKIKSKVWRSGKIEEIESSDIVIRRYN
jgi:Ca2+-transporting ATPase